MALRVVGAGIGRTGTTSLKAALERLLGGPCYHMLEVFTNPEHVPMWQAAADGERVDWDQLFQGYEAGVDWPVGAFWPELTEQYPDAVVVLSTRDSAATWWKSASRTIFRDIEQAPEEWHRMIVAMMTNRFTPDFRDEEAAKAAYERHNAQVRSVVPATRLLEWQPGDGWEPLCARLGLDVPDEPFPHLNTTEEFNAGRDGSST